MSFLVKLLALTVCSRLVNCETSDADILGKVAKTVDFNKFYDKLEKHSKIGIKSYLGNIIFIAKSSFIFI